MSMWLRPFPCPIIKGRCWPGGIKFHGFWYMDPEEGCQNFNKIYYDKYGVLTGVTITLCEAFKVGIQCFRAGAALNGNPMLAPL
jgi:hypothetical protein